MYSIATKICEHNFLNFCFQAIFTYWFTSNVLSLAQVGVMRIPGVKESLGIPATIVPVKSDPDVKPGTFMENLRAGLYFNFNIIMILLSKLLLYKLFSCMLCCSLFKELTKFCLDLYLMVLKGFPPCYNYLVGLILLFLFPSMHNTRVQSSSRSRSCSTC